MTTQTGDLLTGGDRRSTAVLRTRNGFSLVELLVVMAIIVVLMGIALGVAGSAQRSAAENRARAELGNIALELDLYRADKGEYPGGLDALVTWYEEERYVGADWDLTDLSDNDPVDPWGNDYRYRRSGNRNFFSLWSRGPTGDSDDEIHFNR